LGFRLWASGFKVLNPLVSCFGSGAKALRVW